MKPLLLAVAITILMGLGMRSPHKTVQAVEKPVSKPRIAAKKPINTQKSVEASIAPQTPVPAPVVTPRPAYTGTHEQLMASAGIAASDFGAADYIVSHESDWDPAATEPTTGAHGLPQALPYSKTGCGWVDSVCQLRWANKYAIARYGGWWSAYNYWVAHRNW